MPEDSSTTQLTARALESLRRPGLAYYRKEPTGGKPRELWFAEQESTE